MSWLTKIKILWLKLHVAILEIKLAQNITQVLRLEAKIRKLKR